MKKTIALLSAFSMPTQAHESLVPHTHPHGVSMLPGTDAIIGALLVLFVVLIACWRFIRVP